MKIELSNKALDAIDMTWAEMYVDVEEYRLWFTAKSGAEHYRLLTYLSTLFNSEILSDVGTYRGNSAVALAHNTRNVVESFDIVDKRLATHPNVIWNCPINCLDLIDDRDRILVSKVILLDTVHDGIFEKEFISFLHNNSYSGILVLDDIWLNDEMISIWLDLLLSIDNCYDVTEYGHWSGTGIACFGGQTITKL